MNLFKKTMYEAIGTGLLSLLISASGYVGYTLSNGNIGFSLLVNSIITGIGLYSLIVYFRPLSGAEFNPLVSFLLVIKGKNSLLEAIIKSLGQVVGAVVGVIFMHLLFDLAIIQSSMTIRSSYTLWISELLSSIILLIVILRTFELNDHQTGMFIGSIVMIGYWITPSTFFVNPALTFARTLTNTFVGIRLIDAFIFILFQCLALLLFVGLKKKLKSTQ